MRKFIHGLKHLTKKSLFFRIIVRGLVYIVKSIQYTAYFLKNKTHSKLVVFEAYMGRSYACSPKALYEAMLKDKAYDSFEFIWAFQNPEDYQFLKENRNTRLVKYSSGEYFKAYSRAKYWISNSRIPLQIRRREDQAYIQTWHGTPLKKLGFDIETEGGNAMNSLRELRKKNNLDAGRYSCMLSPSAFCTEKFTSAFNLEKLHSKNIIVEKGYPRNDDLFRYDENDRKKVKAALGLSESKKVILYAPTWRDNQHETGLGYTYSPGLDFMRLQRELGSDYIILFRAHYFIANDFDFEAYRGFVIDVSKYDDINDLYIISDLLITDYSSVFFDYANLKRPILFYMYDLDFYKNKLHDFYIELDGLPGDILQTEQELIYAVKKSDRGFCVDDKYTAFNRKFNYLDGPDTSAKVLKEIIGG